LLAIGIIRVFERSARLPGIFERRAAVDRWRRTPGLVENTQGSRRVAARSGTGPPGPSQVGGLQLKIAERGSNSLYMWTSHSH